MQISSTWRKLLAFILQTLILFIQECICAKFGWNWSSGYKKEDLWQYPSECNFTILKKALILYLNILRIPLFMQGYFVPSWVTCLVSSGEEYIMMKIWKRWQKTKTRTFQSEKLTSSFCLLGWVEKDTLTAKRDLINILINILITHIVNFHLFINSLITKHTSIHY